MVDEIAALVQAEIDEIERELHRAEFRGGSDKEVVAKGSTGTAVTLDSKTSAKLLEPFSDVYYDHSFFVDDDDTEEEEEVNGRTPATSPSSATTSGSSATSTSTPRTSIESGSPRRTREAGDDYGREFEVGDDAAFMYDSVRQVAAMDGPTVAPAAAIVAPPPRAITTTTAPSATSSSSTTDTEAYRRGLELFGQIRRILTFKDTVWADIDDELESEEYTDEFDEVVEELGFDSSDAGLGPGLGKGLGLGLSGVRRGMGLGLARSVRIGTVRRGAGGSGGGKISGSGGRVRDGITAASRRVFSER